MYCYHATCIMLLNWLAKVIKTDNDLFYELWDTYRSLAVSHQYYDIDKLWYQISVHVPDIQTPQGLYLVSKYSVNQVTETTSRSLDKSPDKRARELWIGSLPCSYLGVSQHLWYHKALPIYNFATHSAGRKYYKHYHNYSNCG